jgi:amino acid transporter
MPLVWSLPEALITAELGAAYPEASGTVAWVEEAYGPFWGWLQGCLTWVSGATDNAIYPVLFLDYLFQVLGVADDMSFWVRFALLSGICLSLAYINYRGLDLVSELSLTVCFLSMSPFIVFFFVAIPKIDPSRWLQKPDMEALMNSTLYKEELDKENGLFPNGGVFRGILLAPFLNSLFWNLNSFDSAACFASEIENPGHSFPRAMFVAVIFVVVGYMIPILTATGTTDASQDKWVDGYMGTVAEEAVGPWLGGWVVFAAGIANLAMFLAEMSSDAFQILGLAERGYLPKIFSQRSRYGTPTYGILVGTCVILAMSVSNLSSLIELLNFNYAL